MTTHQTHFLCEINGPEPISEGTQAYLEARAKNRFYDYVLKKFLERERLDGFSRADLARKIGRRPEIITRLLGAPGNWTIETGCILLAGICGEELEPHSAPFAGRPCRNYRGADWMSARSGSSATNVIVTVDGGLERLKPTTKHPASFSGWKIEHE